MNKVKSKPNEIEEHNDYIYIILKNKKQQTVAKAIVDKKDYEKIKDYRWHLSDEGYVRTNLYGTTVNIHRLLIPNAKMVDHKNQNRLDNRKSNLRSCDTKQNGQNRKTQKNNSSGVPGVGWKKSVGKWEARIWVNGKTISLGVFKDFQNAFKARQNAECYYFKEFKPTKELKYETNI